MNVQILKECGLSESLYGLWLSYSSSDITKMSDVATKLAPKDGGHNKFLESIVVWLEITAPRYWWSQFDTYRVGTSKQSESTMHTILKKPLTKENFENGELIPPEYIDCLNNHILNMDFVAVKTLLPESFLQKRVVCTNYKVLRNIIKQRKTHKLKEWEIFCEGVQSGVQQPSWLEA